MLHDAGIAVICRVEGEQSPVLTERTRQSFAELAVGVTRYYSAAAAGQTVSRLIQIWRDDTVTTGDLCRIGGRWYNIRQIVPTVDEDGLAVTRLTLEETDGSAWEGAGHG